MKLLKKRKVKVVDPTEYQFVGIQYLEEPQMQVFNYDEKSCEEIQSFKNPGKIKSYLESSKKTWFNIHGIHDSELIKKICNSLNMHRIVIQDLLDTTHVTRIQELDNYLFFTVKSHLIDEKNDTIIEQISFVLGKNYLLTFQEKKGDHFEHIRSRIREKIGLIREKSIDYLLFVLLEAIIDNYHITIQNIESDIESILVFDNDLNLKPDKIFEIEKLKSKVNVLKKSLQPILDSLIKIEKGFSNIIANDNLKYYMVLKDTCLFLSSEMDSNLQKLEGGINLFFSIQNQKMNHIMKTLTIVASIFIPLTFIAGIYGMNFENMPELKWDLGYYIVLFLMLIILTGSFLFFKIKKWFK